jgi:hypothetical protein
MPSTTTTTSSFNIIARARRQVNPITWISGDDSAKRCGHLNIGYVTQQVCSLNQYRKGGDGLGSVVKKRRKKMRKHKHRKLLAKTRHQRRKGK